MKFVFFKIDSILICVEGTGCTKKDFQLANIQYKEMFA